MEALESCRVRLGFIPSAGIQSVADRPEIRSRIRRAGRVLGAATFLALRLQQHKTTAPPPAPDKIIAVLPFENLSSDKENAYFADGVQDEILTRLASLADLKVISRTSVMQYKSGAARDLREIGQQLGVARVVEGSVQRAGNRGARQCPVDRCVATTGAVGANL